MCLHGVNINTELLALRIVTKEQKELLEVVTKAMKSAIYATMHVDSKAGTLSNIEG